MRSLLASAVAVALAPLALAQSDFATSVVQFNQGTGGGIFDTVNILGGPQGAGLGSGSLDVLTLGEGGDVTLGFDVTIVDGPGADLAVFENGFVITGSDQVFAEILFVEVSTDGTTFARFPTRYSGSGSEMGAYRGLAGGMPVLANVLTNPIDPLNPVVSGGEAFDLADLASDPAVVAGTVDLQDIHYVRLVDTLPTDVDGAGTVLPGFGGSDVDAVAVLNSSAGVSAAQPTADLWVDDQNRLNLVLGDPDGFFTLDFLSAQVSLDLVSIDPTVLLSALSVAGLSSTELHLVSPPLTGSGLVAALAVSVADIDGNRSADQAMLQD